MELKQVKLDRFFAKLLSPFHQRLKFATVGERMVYDILNGCFEVQKKGQEEWMPKQLHKLARFSKDPHILQLRHNPDIFVCHKSDCKYCQYASFYLQVKFAQPNYVHFVIESASLDTCKKLMSEKIPVLVCWAVTEEKECYAQWADQIEPDNFLDHDITKYFKPRGSGTPMYQVKREKIPKLREVLQCIA